MSAMDHWAGSASVMTLRSTWKFHFEQNDFSTGSSKKEFSWFPTGAWKFGTKSTGFLEPTGLSPRNAFGRVRPNSSPA